MATVTFKIVTDNDCWMSGTTEVSNQLAEEMKLALMLKKNFQVINKRTNFICFFNKKRSENLGRLNTLKYRR